MHKWMLTPGLAALAIVVAAMSSQIPSPTSTVAHEEAALRKSCVRYGDFECCYKPDGQSVRTDEMGEAEDTCAGW